jgi:hypothetical protein
MMTSLQYVALLLIMMAGGAGAAVSAMKSFMEANECSGRKQAGKRMVGILFLVLVIVILYLPTILQTTFSATLTK